MHQLTGLDGAFLAMETHAVFGHVGSVSTLAPGEPLTLASVTERVGERLPLLPQFRRRLVGVPLGLDQPWWIEDPDFDIEYHVREIALPAPGDDAQLAEQAARLHARPLDRNRPLWETYLISGLSDGRQALYTKVHHAAIDGVSGNDLMFALLDLTPEGREAPVENFIAERAPGTGYLLARSALALTGHPVRAARLVGQMAVRAPRFAPSLTGSIPLPRALDILLRGPQHKPMSSPGLRAPKTPFNAPITPHRRWAFCDVPLTEVKAVKNAAGATVNDVVMALCAGALRRWLILHDALPEGPLLAAVPVSIRTAEEKGTGGNKISSMIAALPTHLEEPKSRLDAAHDAMLIAKDTHGALPADLLSDVTQFAMPALAGQAARLAARLRMVERISPFNLFVSNVPGPAVPLYFHGARLLGYYPLSAIADGQGLNMTVISCNGNLNFGLIACRELVPDLDELARFVREESALLIEAYGVSV